MSHAQVLINQLMKYQTRAMEVLQEGKDLWERLDELFKPLKSAQKIQVPYDCLPNSLATEQVYIDYDPCSSIKTVLEYTSMERSPTPDEELYILRKLMEP